MVINQGKQDRYVKYKKE